MPEHQEIVRNEERFRLLSDKVEKNKRADAEIAAEPAGTAGRERREEAAMFRKHVIVAGVVVATAYRLGSESSRGYVAKV